MIPAPSFHAPADGAFIARGSVTVAADGLAADAVARLAERLWAGARVRLDRASDAAIVFTQDAAFAPEAYRVEVAPASIRVHAGDAAGFSHAVSTLLQLAGGLGRSASAARSVEFAAGVIDDAPRFAWRGLMLDVARHFLPVREVLRQLDLMALHKFNRLHLHLSDDQGWRVEIAAFPRLTEVAAWRASTQIGANDADAPELVRPHGGFYTQDDLREIVAYAAARGITVVPEIDVPGHSQAAIAAYPELGVGSPDVDVWPRFGVSDFPLNAEEATVDFYRTVLDELLEIFPSADIGLGGDEVPSAPWEADARSWELVRERGLEHPRDLQFWFLDQLRQHIESRGRRMMAWDEVLEHSDITDVTVLGWRGDAGIRAAVARSIPVVSCPDDRMYFDYRQSDDPREPVPVSVVVGVAEVLAFDPVPAGATSEEAAVVRGGQANLWTEHLDSPRAVDYMLWPRAAALAEVLWTGPGVDADDFALRLSDHLALLDERGVEYRRADGPLPWQERPGIPGRIQDRDERQRAIDELTAAIEI